MVPVGSMRTVGAFERPDASAFDITRDTKTEIATLLADLLLASTECWKTADRTEHLVQSTRIIPAVVDDGLAVSVRDPHRIRHLICTDHVAPPHLSRFESKRRRNQIHCTLHCKRRLWTACSSIWGVRNLIRRSDTRSRCEIRNLVWAEQVDGGVVGNSSTDRVPCAAINDEFIPKSDDPALVIEADLNLVQLVP